MAWKATALSVVPFSTTDTWTALPSSEGVCLHVRAEQRVRL